MERLLRPRPVIHHGRWVVPGRTGQDYSVLRTNKMYGQTNRSSRFRRSRSPTNEAEIWAGWQMRDLPIMVRHGAIGGTELDVLIGRDIRREWIDSIRQVVREQDDSLLYWVVCLSVDTAEPSAALFVPSYQAE